MQYQSNESNAVDTKHSPRSPMQYQPTTTKNAHQGVQCSISRSLQGGIGPLFISRRDGRASLGWHSVEEIEI